MRRLIKWIKKILGITDLEDSRTATQLTLSSLLKKHFDNKDAIEHIQKTINIGVDFHYYRENESWAVVCINGKAEFVKFYLLDNSDATVVRNFLAGFGSKSSKIIDRPRGIDKKWFI